MKYLLSLFIFIPLLLFSYDIAVIGDSISAGYGLKQEESYSGILKLKLPGITINNTAVNFGSTKQTDEFIFKVFNYDSPKILILALGTADAGYYQISPSVIYQQFEKIIKIALSRGTIVLIGKVELGERFNHLSTEYKTEFKNMYSEIERNYPVIPFEFMTNILFLDPKYTLDGTHPNAEGHKVIENVLEPIINLFTK
jgi:acyl-CoA thioesterase-1